MLTLNKYKFMSVKRLCSAWQNSFLTFSRDWLQFTDIVHLKLWWIDLRGTVDAPVVPLLENSSWWFISWRVVSHTYSSRLDSASISQSCFGKFWYASGVITFIHVNLDWKSWRHMSEHARRKGGQNMSPRVGTHLYQKFTYGMTIFLSISSYRYRPQKISRSPETVRRYNWSPYEIFLSGNIYLSAEITMPCNK